MRACQNPACARDLDQVVPRLRADARYCSRTCGREHSRQTHAERFEDPSTPERFWGALRAARTRQRPLTGPLRERHREQVAVPAEGAGVS